MTIVRNINANFLQSLFGLCGKTFAAKKKKLLKPKKLKKVLEKNNMSRRNNFGNRGGRSYNSKRGYNNSSYSSRGSSRARGSICKFAMRSECKSSKCEFSHALKLLGETRGHSGSINDVVMWNAQQQVLTCATDSNIKVIRNIYLGF